MSRIQTGVIECDGDWPGIFIRGDQAVHYAHSLSVILKNMPESEKNDVILSKHVLTGLIETLHSCNMNSGTFDVENIQYVKLINKENNS